MKLNTLKTPEINQNGYHKNSLTKERIGTLFIYPIDFTPDDCLSCEGYSLLIEDYKDLYKIIGKQFNKSDDAAGTFRIPDYNVTKRFLQPGSNAGNQVEAGLPNISGWLSDINSGGITCGGAFYYANTSTHKANNTAAISGGWGFSASLSNPIYGKSLTVQPPSQLVHICIKYK